MGAKDFVDVNREDYLKAMFTELVGQKNMISFTEKAKVIYDFVLGNPSNENIANAKLRMVEEQNISDNLSHFDAKGLARTEEGYYLISARKWKTKKRSGKKKRKDKK